MTLIEAMIAMAIVAIALLALVSLIVSAGTVQDDSRQRTIAYNTAREIVEDMRSLLDVTKIYAKYKSGGTTGNEFWIADIPGGDGTSKKTATGATYKAQGKILFPELNAGSGDGKIAEDPPNPSDDILLKTQLGMPKDLNQSGDSTETLDITEVKILPVKIRVRWLSNTGRLSNVEVITMITSR